MAEVNVASPTDLVAKEDKIYVVGAGESSGETDFLVPDKEEGEYNCNLCNLMNVLEGITRFHESPVPTKELQSVTKCFKKHLLHQGMLKLNPEKDSLQSFVEKIKEMKWARRINLYSIREFDSVADML